MNWLGVSLIVIGISYFIYSIMFRNKKTYYFKKIEIVEGKEEKYFMMQLYSSVLNSLILLLTGIYSVIYNPQPPIALLVPAIFHLVNHLAKERGKINGYIQ
ncbi:hypothetical protein [Alkaliphilus peptidifermentans]|uniref:DUF3784 domain-containing protein n=1 Tax=Alkaliphilus peptidifermentans DSM 18978 TaxID=1120976 RepID=A0A1G5C1C0_9FIRM|nr:hypothetical protein [Alkaliphilus peptidifermentans]SCX96178.1 hypothetical protein SAMN03080606_00588 [Alkaliphilus peptidifermentans DSM 18978]